MWGLVVWVAWAAGGGRDCPAQQLAPRWLAARASCACAPAARLFVAWPERAAPEAHAVTRLVLHPAEDVCLLRLGAPHARLNASAAAPDAPAFMTPPVWRWATSVFSSEGGEEDVPGMGKPVPSLLPIKMFCLTILLPCMLFALFFMYCIFYTGTTHEIPYTQQIDDDAKDI